MSDLCKTGTAGSTTHGNASGSRSDRDSRVDILGRSVAVSSVADLGEVVAGTGSISIASLQ